MLDAFLKFQIFPRSIPPNPPTMKTTDPQNELKFLHQCLTHFHKLRPQPFPKQLKNFNATNRNIVGSC